MKKSFTLKAVIENTTDNYHDPNNQQAISQQNNKNFFENPYIKSDITIQRTQGRLITISNTSNADNETERPRNFSSPTPNKKNNHINNSEVFAYKNKVLTTHQTHNKDLVLHPVIIDQQHNFNYNPNSIPSKINFNTRKGSQYTNINVVARFRPLTTAELVFNIFIN